MKSSGTNRWAMLATTMLIGAAVTGGCSVNGASERTGENAGHGGGATKPATVDEGSSAEPRGSYVIVNSQARASVGEAKAFKTTSATARRTIYVNGRGATITRANSDDSSNQQSSIINGTVTIPPYGGSSTQWATFMTCIKDEFARWNVNVTDQDPGATPHIEGMIGGRSSDAGFGQGVGGVSPMTNDCSLIETAIVYVFSAAFNEDPTVSCEVAAQELGHAIGMDHEYDCQDPMTYLQGCGHKTFQDRAVSCGESGPRTCSCGSPTQNSVQFMNARLGLSVGNPPPPPPPPPPTNDTTPPSISAISPANGATLAANTTISISAHITDPDDAVASALLTWEYNGQTLSFDCANPPNGFTCTSNGGNYTWSLSVGSGPRAFTITAQDSHGNTATSARQTLTLGNGNPPPPPPPPNGPSVTFDSPSAGTVVSPGGLVAIRITATDAASITSASLRWHSPSGDRLFDLASMGGNDWGASLQLSTAAVSGPRTLRVTVTDSNSQQASTSDVIIQVQ